MASTILSSSPSNSSFGTNSFGGIHRLISSSASCYHDDDFDDHDCIVSSTSSLDHFHDTTSNSSFGPKVESDQICKEDNGMYNVRLDLKEKKVEAQRNSSIPPGQHPNMIVNESSSPITISRARAALGDGGASTLREQTLSDDYNSSGTSDLCFDDKIPSLYPVITGVSHIDPMDYAGIDSAAKLFPCKNQSNKRHQQRLSRLVGSPAAAPSWTQLSSEVLPAAAREILSSSLHRLYYTARVTYSLATWTQQYSEYGNAVGYNLQRQYGAQAFVDNLQNISKTGGNNNTSLNSQLRSLVTVDDLPRFSSLRWTERQLVKEWRTYSPTCQSASKVEDDSSLDDVLLGEKIDDVDDDFDSARVHVPTPLERPQWEQLDVCFVCHKTFGPTLLRHHCRLCGKSVCHNDSRHTRNLPQLGYHPDVPERVCDNCASIVWEQNLAERIVWRLARCRDYENGELSPYFESGYDSVEQKAFRIAEAALTMAKSIPLGAQASIAVETADVFRRYGLVGIYTIMLRQEFLAAADLLRKALGINQTAWPLSVHELSAAIFYALAQHRAMRGINPEYEQLIHSCRSCDENSSIDDDTEVDQSKEKRHNVGATGNALQMGGHSVPPMICVEDEPCLKQTEIGNSVRPVCDPIPDSVISSIIFYAPLALNFIYLEKEVDMQLLAAQQGWRLIYAYLNMERDGTNVGTGRGGSDHMIHDRPASAVFVHESEKVACLVIRGTSTIQDVITDIRQVPVLFPEQQAVSGHEDANYDSLRDHEEWTDVAFQTGSGGLAVAGMASAAFNLYREHIDCLISLARQGFRIRLAGHSLGGSVATLLAVLINKDLKELRVSFNSSSMSSQYPIMDKIERTTLLRVYGFGSPCSVDESLAKIVESFVVTTVLHDDVVPRLSPLACRGLMKHLLHIRETWVKTHLPNDIRAFADRARTVWAPRWRGGFALPIATSSSLRLGRYCRKHIQNGRARLRSMKKTLDLYDKHGNRKETSAHAYSVSYRPFENGRRSYVYEENVVNAQKVETSQYDDENEKNKEKDLFPGCLITDYMGHLNSNTGDGGMIVDGDEFYDTGSLLEGSSDVEDEDGSYSSNDDVNDRKMRRSMLAETPGYHERKNGLRTDLDEFDNTETDLYSSMTMESPMPAVDYDETHAEAVMLEEVPLPRMFVPGKIVHIYTYHGVFKAVFVPRTFRELRRISMAGNMLSDHKAQSYYDAILEVRSVRRAPENPPSWTAFDEDDKCSCCASRFTWASTSDSEAQEARDKHNCRSCGALVCHPCSKHRVSLPTVGLNTSSRVCDRCYYNDVDGSPALESGRLGSSIIPTIDTVDSSKLLHDVNKPIRNRAKRSAVVDELASRVHATSF